MQTNYSCRFNKFDNITNIIIVTFDCWLLLPLFTILHNRCRRRDYLYYSNDAQNRRPPDQMIISDPVDHRQWSFSGHFKITRLHVTGHRLTAAGALVRKCLAVVVRSGVLWVELALRDVLGEAGDVLPVVVHPLHAARQRPAGGEVERLQGGTAVQQLGQSLQTHPGSIQVQLPER